jgi:hypothetical protein
VRFPRVRLTVRQLAIALVVVGICFIPARWVWRAQGGTLPSLSGLRVGMTQAQVAAVVGPPSSRGDRPDGTSWLTITRPGSLYWIEVEFDQAGRLRVARKESF